MTARSRVGVAAALTGLAILPATACAPGAAPGGGQGAPGASASPRAVRTDAAALGQVTLTVWDQEVRGGGNAQIQALNAAFMKKYPNITIKRNSRSFDDLVKTLRLALSGNEAPDVVQANNTRSQMGEFVKAKQLLPLDPWMQAYGWDQRYGESVRSVVSYSPDGKTFGSGNLYGMPQVGEVIGVFVNTAKLKAAGVNPPTTWTEFEQALATLKAKGEPPLMLGNLDKWPALHVFGVVQGQYVEPDEIRALGFGNKGASWTTPQNKAALDKLVEWVDKGYFNAGFNGTGYDPAWQAFSKGKGAFLIGGTWLQADLSKAMGDKVSFMLPPPAQAGGVAYTTGASGQPFAITSKAKNPDAAAAYIDFLTSEEAMAVIAANEGLPVVDAAKQKAPNPLAQQVFTAFDTTTQKNALLPYLDWATPTMNDTIGAAMQDLLAKKATSEQVAETIEADYSAFANKG